MGLHGLLDGHGAAGRAITQAKQVIQLAATCWRLIVNQVMIWRSTSGGIRMIGKLIGSAAALALIAGTAAPASARPYWGHHHHRGGDTFGNILLGAIIGGGLVAVASSAKNKERSIPSRRGADQREDLREDGEDAREVASLCSDAIENMARGPVSSVDSVGRDGRDGWRVEGVVRGERGDRSFRCAVQDGQIEMIDLGERLAAR